MAKIIRLNEIKKYIKPFKATLAGGGFDLFHIGHLKYLIKCSEIGKPLIVVIQSDKTIKIRKGFNRPIIPQKERAQIISWLAMVDYVLILEKPFYSFEYIDIIKPAAIVLSKENLKFRKEVVKTIQNKYPQIRAFFIPKQSKITSTSALVNKISTKSKNFLKVKDSLIRELIEISQKSTSNLGKTSALIKMDGNVVARACNVGEKHAEELVIEKAKKLKIPLDKCEFYSLINPCILCSRLILKNKIGSVNYIYDYGLNNGKKLLKKNNITITKYKK